MSNVVEIEVRGHDRTRGTFGSVGAGLGALRSRALSLLKPLAGAALNVASLASTALTLAPAVVSAARGIGQVLGAAVQASPALLGLAAAGAFVMLTMKQIGPAVGKAFEPVTKAFTDAGTKAGELAARGVRPLAEEFARVNMPNIAGGMNRIAEATNGVLHGFMAWANSAAGVQAVRAVVDSTASAFERVGPSVTTFATSLGNMLGRIAGVSTAAGASGLTGILDALTERMNRVNQASVQGGLDKLKASYEAVRNAVTTVVDVISRAVDIYSRYRTEFALLSDAIAVLAIAFGGPITVAIAAIGLIIRHFDQLKAAWQSVVTFFTATPMGTGFLTNLATAAQTVIPPLMAAFQQIKAAVVPVLQEIWAKIQTQVIPAFGAFIAAIAPVVAFMVGVLGPTVAAVMRGILTVISGVIDIIVGVIKTFTGVLRGDWSMAWEGVKQICSGAWQALGGIVRAGVALVRGAFNMIVGILGAVARTAWSAATAAFRAGVNAVVGVARSIGGRISGALGNLGGLLSGAGRALMNGLLNGIKSAASAVYNYVKGIAGKIKALKGPLPKDLRLLVPAGNAIMAGLLQGISRGVQPVLRTVAALGPRIADQLSVQAGFSAARTSGYAAAAGRAAGAGSTVRLELRSGGGRLEDMLMEIIRRSIRVEGGNVQVVLGS